MKNSRRLRERGFTLIELTVAVALSTVVGILIAAYLSGNSLLFAKNISTNLTHNSVRSSLDKLIQDVTQGCSTITVVDTSGQAVANGTAGAGIRFDRYKGGPYVVTHPGGTGIASTATTVTITRTTNPSVVPPLPTAGDVLMLDGANGVRLVVGSVSAGIIDATTKLQNITVTLANPPGTAINWNSGRTKLARLVRRQAYVVIPSGSRNELRFFGAAENITNYSTSSNFSLVVKNVGIDLGDSTPFTISTLDDKAYLRVQFRMRSDQFANRLANKEANKFSAIHRIETLLNPRGT